MPSLDDFCLERDTDKSSSHHDYCTWYQSNLKPHESIKDLLEIGIQEGKSLRAWRDFLPHARIVGMDLAHPEAESNDHGCICRHADQDDMISLKNAIGDDMFDIILDDGGHSMRQQVNTLYAYWPHVKRGGAFIMEDLHTSPDYSKHTTLGFIAGAKETGHPMLTDLDSILCNFDIDGREQNEHMTCILQKHI